MLMSLKDYCRLPGESRNAGAEDIRRVFRQLAMQYHPGHNSENAREAETGFKEIERCYR